MRRVLICSGVLGGGTALVFALAALTATLFPHGTVVPTNPFGWGGRGDWGGVAIDPMPMVAPAIEETEPFVFNDMVDEGKP